MARRTSALVACLVVLAACKERDPGPPAAPSAKEPPPPVAESPFAAPATASSASAAAPPTTVIAQHVLIAYRGAKRAQPRVTRTKDEAKKLAAEVRKSLEGADTDAFTAAVKRYSDDPAAIERLGSTGKAKREDLDKAFADVAFALKVGETSGVVETPFGFHIIRRNQ